MKQSEQKNPRHLTGLDVGPTLAIPERRQGEPANERENLPGFKHNDFRIHSRDVYVLLHQQHRAGVFHGINSEANSGFRQPTRHEAWWVFAFSGGWLTPRQIERFVMTA